MLSVTNTLSPVGQGVLCMAGNSLIWGTSEAVLAGRNTHPLVTGGIVYAVMAGLLIPLARVMGQSLKAAISNQGARKLALLGALEVGILLTFLVAARMAPLGPVVAVQLTFPVMIMIWELSRRFRLLTWRCVATIGLIAAALVLVSVTSDGGGHSHAWFGLAIALLSAMMLAVYTEVTRRAASHVSAVPATACITAIAAVLLSIITLIASSASPQVPALNIGQVHWVDVRASLMVGALCAGAALLSWTGAKLLSAVTAGNLRLLEPFIASGAAYCIFGTSASPVQLLAVAIVMAAVYIDLHSLVEQQPSPRKEAILQ